ncbi:hypothetical protein [Streptomyces sp. NPDC059701]|uniref:hypothetical protein n=1 Tax=Streptomyces sp. NPDC059701 TaxID=3346914 RepID=UPI00367E1311
MEQLRRTAIGAVAVVAALSLAACGGSDDGGTDGEPTSGQSTSGGTGAEQPVPPAFDGAEGWTIQAEDGGDEPDRPVIAPGAGLVLVRTNAADQKSTRVVAHDARTGKVRWSSAPMDRPTPGDGRDNIDVRVFVTSKDGKEYAVLAATGTEGGDGVNKASAVTRLAAYPTDSTGEQVAPVKETTLPGLASEGYGVLSDGGLAMVTLGRETAVVDVLSGSTTLHDGESPVLKAPKPCERSFGSCDESAEIVGQTQAGPLVEGDQAFWSGGWFSGDVVPAGAAAEEGWAEVSVYGTPGGQVVAAWPKRGGSGDDRIWAVHDGRTGAVLASVECGAPGNDGPVPFQSAGGRYVVAGLAVLDTQGGRGNCFRATDARNRIEVVSVDDDGTAYGKAVKTDGVGSVDVPVSVDLAADKATPLPEGTLLPDLVGARAAVFGTSTAGGERIVVHARR